MSRIRLHALPATLLLLAWPVQATAAQIQGDYLETRSADVYTGPCFANGEVGLTGEEAILAWRVRAGDWNGVPLDGLSVVGVVKASHTLGDPFGNPLPARAVMILDEEATAEQRDALVGFAQEMAGDLLDDVVRREIVPIRIEITHEGGHYGKALLDAGDLVSVRTRSIGSMDHICGNEETYYEPLAPMSHAMPAVAMLDRYSGPGLGVSWTSHDKRSAFVGSFSRHRAE